jgi:hypothetical protein
VLAEATAAGFEVLDAVEGQGFAPFKSEDPVVARVRLAPGAALSAPVAEATEQLATAVTGG